MFQPQVRAALETKFLQTALGGQARFCDLIAEFCSMWAGLKDGEASHRPVHPVPVDCKALQGGTTVSNVLT